MRAFFLALGLMLTNMGFSQERCATEPSYYYPLASRVYDSIMASKVPVLTLPGDYLFKALPVSVDNSTNKYFPGILDQHLFFSCQQHSGVAYLFGYEINRLRDLDSKSEVNRYPTHYTWNFMNNGDRFAGVGFFYSWDVLKSQGHPTLNDWGVDTAGHGIDWMTGYDKYYRGMKNRIKAVYSIPVNTEEGILTLKHYLHDHLDGSLVGGIACYGASGNLTDKNFKKVPAGTPGAGRNIITGFYPNATHGMTVVGYNDSVRFDLNGDGLYTNTIDITNDGKVDPCDWELGAYKMANSHGTWWSDTGYSYVMYRSLALYYGNNPDFWDPVHGAWNQSVYILEPEAEYEPLLTMKVRMTHTSRDKIRIKAGVSSDTSSIYPEHIIEFPFFTFHGGDFGMKGPASVPGNTTIEVGLDVTPLLSYLEPNQQAKFFLLIEEKDPDQLGQGELNRFSFLDYTGGVTEMMGSSINVPLRENDLSLFSVTGAVGFDKVEISSVNLPAIVPGGAPIQQQLQATGGTQPYSWTLLDTYEENVSNSPFPLINQQALYYESVGVAYKRVILPFRFPFYGKEYDTVYVNAYGFLAFESTQLPYMYLTDEEGMLRRSRVISPAFSYQYVLAYGAKGMWMESNPEEATFRWKLRLVDHDTSVYINFAARLKANGEFEFLYGEIPLLDPQFTTWSGHSIGDEANYKTTTNWNTADLAHQSRLFRPKPSPEGISLSKQGLLIVSDADTGYIYEVRVRASDKYGLRDEQLLPLSSGLLITEALVSDTDSLLKFGENLHCLLRVTNNGLQAIQNLQVRLLTGDTTVMVTDSLVTIPNLPVGGTAVLNNVFSFHLTSPLPDQSGIDLSLIATAGERQWTKNIRMSVLAPDVSVFSEVISDGANQILEPGEVADLSIRIDNNGSVSTDFLSVALYTDDTLVSILAGPVYAVDRIGSHMSLVVKYTIMASRWAPDGHSSSFFFGVNDGKTVDLNHSFSLLLGKLPVLLVSLSSDTSSVESMKGALDTLQVSYISLNHLPENLADYSAVFVSAGTKYTGSHLLTTEEGDLLASYLHSGGKLYLESYSTWYYQKKTRVHPYFKYTSVKVPVWFYPEVKGLPFTFSDSLRFPYQHTTNYALFNLVPVFPAFTSFTNSDSVSRGTQVVYKGVDYATIGSMFEFGSLADTVAPSNKANLMRRYLDLFEVALPGPRALFHADKLSICRWGEISFSDDSFNGVVSREWYFAGGSPASSSDQNPTVQYIDAGDYDVKLTVWDGVNTRTITKSGYIHVNACAGIESITSTDHFTVFPNPVENSFTVRFKTRIPNGFSIDLYNGMGRKMTGWSQFINMDGKEVTCDIGNFPSGIYFLVVRSSGGGKSAKIVVQ